jgi:hypothetical protein
MKVNMTVKMKTGKQMGSTNVEEATSTEIRSGDMRARRPARSDTPHPLDSGASLFHTLHNIRLGSIGNWPLRLASSIFLASFLLPLISFSTSRRMA